MPTLVSEDPRYDLGTLTPADTDGGFRARANAANVTVAIADNDAAALVLAAPDGKSSARAGGSLLSLTFEEGTSTAAAYYTVRLASRPYAPVNVTLGGALNATTSRGGGGFDGARNATLAFGDNATDWATPRVVPLRVRADDVASGDRTWLVTHEVASTGDAMYSLRARALDAGASMAQADYVDWLLSDDVGDDDGGGNNATMATAPSLALTVLDDDAAGVALSWRTITLGCAAADGRAVFSDMFEVSLGSEPRRPVTLHFDVEGVVTPSVAAASSSSNRSYDVSLRFSPPSGALVFDATNWRAARAVVVNATVSAAALDDDDGGGNNASSSSAAAAVAAFAVLSGDERFSVDVAVSSRSRDMAYDSEHAGWSALSIDTLRADVAITADDVAPPKVAS